MLLVVIPLNVCPAQEAIPVGEIVILSVILKFLGDILSRTVSAEKSVVIPPTLEKVWYIDLISFLFFASIAVIERTYSVPSLREICSPTINCPEVWVNVISELDAPGEVTTKPVAPLLKPFT